MSENLAATPNVGKAIIHMSLPGLLDAVTADRGIAALLEAAATAGRTSFDLAAPRSVRPFALAALARAQDGRRPVLAVTATGREAEDLTAALRSFLDPDGVVDFPAWETLPHERLSPRSDTVGRRLAVLRRLVHPDSGTEGAGAVSASWPRSVRCCSRR